MTHQQTHSIEISVNGETRAVAHGTTLRDIVAELTGKTLGDAGSPADGSRLGIAAAVDGEVVPRGRWTQQALTQGQSIDIVTAVQGG